ncbi:hypothetical protein M409DRAFT_21332 [Zasmidium cellare ATCC 36951]|uniref:AB hydrolase-1 domain-containing protein n=1 Tax=Zasmidium cellare ATCC 36951 TaxID=1080233 RepID=A0A6A6CRY1_ZASCE|nr:uncharacterized protein M409DRAFT_21332 [Zasmidium cellare ATCC 36951]KAF2168582.1 hypothetical protein M409DRAFT_21332 [Zasmidium cellare ATCC 36951]
MSNLHFVLVHGAYHRAWHFKFLQEELEKAGHKVSTLDLPSGSEDGPEDNAMSADTSAIKSALETAASHSPTIVPVFHSYGGIPGSDAAAELSEAAKNKVLRLIFIGSFIFPANTSLLSLSGGKTASWAQPVPENPKYRYVPDPIPTFFHDVEPARAQEAAAHLVQNAVSAFREPTKYAGWSGFECTYVFCEEDRVVPSAAAERMLGAMTEAQRKRWRTEEIGGSHSPFLSRPAELARLLGRITAGEDGEKL